MTTGSENSKSFEENDTAGNSAALGKLFWGELDDEELDDNEEDDPNCDVTIKGRDDGALDVNGVSLITGNDGKLNNGEGIDTDLVFRS